MNEFSPRVLEIDAEAACERLAAEMRAIIGQRLRRQGAIVAVSGGVDSAVCAALAARALGPERVLGLLLPERDSAAHSTSQGRAVCDALGIAYEFIDITSILVSLDCYERRDAAARRIWPDLEPGFQMKIAVADDLLTTDRLNYFNLVVATADGIQRKQRMPYDVYLEIVAATNMKQRVRKLLEYYHAEKRNYAVLGTPNRLEYELGFFVRGGDGLADVKPIAHLYKTQVYALARHFGLPPAVCDQAPSTDTYSLPQTQEEFYFALPYDQMDLLLHAYSRQTPAEEAARVVGLTAEQVARVYRDIAVKRRTAASLHQPPLLIGAPEDGFQAGRAAGCADLEQVI